MTRAVIRDLPSGVNCYEDVNGRGESSWRIRLGSRFTGGKALKKNFRTVREAREWFHGEAQALRAHTETPLALKTKAGASGFELSARQISDAATAIRLLGEAGTLAEAATCYLQRATPPEGERTVRAAIDAVLKSKEAAGRGDRHVKGLRCNFNRFAKRFAQSMVHQVKKSDVEKWLDDEGFVKTTRRNYLRDLNILFQAALNQGWAVTNPVLHIERPSGSTDEYEILKPDEVAEFLAIAEELAPNECAALAIKFFAGLRTSELFELDWSNIVNGQILVKAAHAKTRQRRSVTIAPNLAKWLDRYPRDGLVTLQRDNAWHRALQGLKESLNARRQIVGKSAPRFTLPPNVARHCFCSYHYELHRNENLTAAEAGNTPAVIFRNYRSLATPAEAIEYWSIEP